MKQYEYNVITNDTPLQERMLNRLGTEGWSLSSHTYSHFPHTPDRHVYTFKREKIGLPKGIANTLTAYQGEDPLPLYDGKTGEQVNKRKFKLDDSFKKRIEEAVVEDIPASSWMDAYKYAYDNELASGMFFEWHPTWTGVWDKDKYAFCHEFIKKHEKGSPQDPVVYKRTNIITIEDQMNLYREMNDKEIERMNIEEYDRALNAILDEDTWLEIEETPEEAAYRKGYMDGYDEGLYDGENK